MWQYVASGGSRAGSYHRAGGNALLRHCVRLLARAGPCLGTAPSHAAGRGAIVARLLWGWLAGPVVLRLLAGPGGGHLPGGGVLRWVMAIMCEVRVGYEDSCIAVWGLHTRAHKRP